MLKVALYHNGINVEGGVGGANNFFLNFFKSAHELGLPEGLSLYFITDMESYRNIAYNHFLKKRKILSYIIPLRIYRNRFKLLLDSIEWIFKILYYRLDIIHICQYYYQEHDHRIKSLKWLPDFIRPRIVVNFIHCNFVYDYLRPESPNYHEFHKRFDYLFNNLKIDGVYSWYELFCEFAVKNNLFKYPVKCKSAQYYCCDSEKYLPSDVKEKKIIYAARFDSQKNPLMYLEAINLLIKNHASKIKGWKFLLYGKGVLLPEIEEFIQKRGLNEWVELRTDVKDMSNVFSYTSCFVSTQEYENFTSLSMIEAMSCGNAIISRNVGQTHFFVKDNLNGLLLQHDTVEDLAHKILKFITMPVEMQKQMQIESRNLVMNYHNEKNFINHLYTFWKEIKNT